MFFLAFLFVAGCATEGRKVILPSGNSPTPWVFDVIGDNRGNDSEYRQLVKMMVADKPSFIVNVGDLTLLPGLGITKFRERSAPIRCPYLFCPGNHDINNDNESGYLRWWGQPGLYYSFQFGGLNFIILNSENFVENTPATEKQIAWLKGELDKPGMKVVFLHRPIYANKYHSPLTDEVRSRLHELFKAGGAAVVFQGHDHTYSRENHDGIEYIVTGGGGAPLVTSWREGGFYHYVRADVGDSEITLRVIDIAGKVRETIPIRR